MFLNLLIQDAVLVLIVSILPPGWMDITLNDYFQGVYVESVLGMVSLINRISDPRLEMFSFISVISGGTSFMWLLLISILGGGLIADDRLHKTTEAYFSRISRFEYLLGKLLSLVLFSIIVVTLPAVLQYLLLAWSLRLDLIANLWLMFWAIGFTLIAVFVISTLTLAISSITTRRTVATMSILIIAIMSSALPGAFGLIGSADTPLLLIDFIGAISLLGAVILGYDAVDINYRRVYLYNGVGVEAGLVVGVVVIIYVISLLILFNILFRRDS